MTNSFNGARALRFDIGFMRAHCSNGVIFKEEVATIKASHSTEALAKLKIEITSRSLPQMWKEFSKFVSIIRSIKMGPDQSILALNIVLHTPSAKPDGKPARKDGLSSLAADFSSRLHSYRNELGSNAYALFNTLTDIAARPPESVHSQKDRNTIEKRSGRWLKELSRQSQMPNFDLNGWIPAWDKSSPGRGSAPGRN